MTPSKSSRKSASSQRLFQGEGLFLTSNSYSLADRPFILSNGTKKTDPETRKLIRSHVMLGKNRRNNRHGKSRDLEVIGAAGVSNYQPAFAKRFIAVIPRKVGSDLAFTTFPDTIDPQEAAEALTQGVTMAKAKYVLESCLIFEEPGAPWSSAWIEQLSINALFLQSVIFTAQTYFDLMRGRNSSQPSQIHLKTLQLLREKLSFGDEKAQLADTTVCVVVNLATHAHISGDDKSAKHHLEGLRKIIELRGGLNNFTKTKPLVDLLRCDIGMALHTGAKPIFFSDNRSQLSLIYPEEITSRCETDRVFDELDDLDDDIAKTWQFMKNFCSLVNLAAKAQGRIPWELFLNTMTSLMYRLLHMSFDVNSINEAIRIGLLAFSSHIFLQWKLVRVNYVHLSVSYRNCLDRLESSHCIPSHLSAWLLMIGAVSVFKQPDDAWLVPRLRANIESCGVKSWSEMRDILESLLWIPLVQEKSGKDIFDSVFGSK